MNKKEIERYFFFPICNKTEIDRIFAVRNASDYLLKLRAETIVDHMRLFRVYRNKVFRDEKNWSLEKSFETTHYDNFLRYLSKDNKEQCQKVAYGNMFSNDPNGSVFATKYGPIITISDALRFFLKFSHLALLRFKCDVPLNVRKNALRIAIRVMLKTEALDFYMDPRGIIPKTVFKAIHAPISLQLEFIAGHEFAHYVLGHLKDSNLIDKPIYFAINSKEKDYKLLKVYNQSQKNELEADIQAILLPKYNSRKLKEMLEAALLWFCSLYLYEETFDAICPRSPWNIQTHPSAKERFDNLLSNIPTPAGLDIEYWESVFKNIEKYKEFLLADVSGNIEMYEMYGSVYLDKPNTKWRGRELIDRVDYY